MKELNSMRTKALVGQTIAIIFIVIGFIMLFTSSTGGMIFILLGGGISIFIDMTITKKFKENYKMIICKEVLDKMFDIEEYRPMKGFDEDFVRNSALIRNGNRFSSDDYIKGSYNGIHFERSDVTMKDVRSNGKTTTTVTLYEGSWTIFTFPKNISSFVMIREKEFLSNGKPGSIFYNHPTTSKVLFEDIDFNDHFEVYAENEHDAFYVCTPHFIEMIKDLESRFDGRCTIGIMNQKVHVLFDERKNRMEPSILNPIDEQDYKIIEKEMRNIIDIINVMQHFVEE